MHVVVSVVSCDNIKRPDRYNAIVTTTTSSKVEVGVSLISEHVSGLTRILARSRLAAALLHWLD